MAALSPCSGGEGAPPEAWSKALVARGSPQFRAVLGPSSFQRGGPEQLALPVLQGRLAQTRGGGELGSSWLWPGVWLPPPAPGAAPSSPPREQPPRGATLAPHIGHTPASWALALGREGVPAGMCLALWG
ncbi:transmembrane 9 superfamily member 1 [Platysternon megacephalum]|uniref:Transmembrane 9 superfamily member 1 n=1 Tax=Platysternon megacephalum TaxID=55544 RepID=A0A4D9DUF5_9SAUR|nr:transmembrane 9 superfamily member 1 [Platysternon megacephalum]